MSETKHTQGNTEVVNESIIDSISKPAPIPPQSSIIAIPRFSDLDREKDSYKKYYVPKFVSIGPYHSWNPKFEYAEKLKPHFTTRLLNNETIRGLLEKLGEEATVQRLRRCYDRDSIAIVSDEKFIKMMLLDSCFILYYIHIYDDIAELNRNQLYIIYQDLLLLENQIPFEVLTEVMNVTKSFEEVEEFINTFSIVKHRAQNRTRLHKLKLQLRRSLFCIPDVRSSKGGNHEDDKKPCHLLAAVRGNVTKIVETPKRNRKKFKYHGWNFRNVSELVNIGISFKAINETTSLTHIEFVKGWWWFSATIKLPPISLSDSTKQVLLNMIAYETYCCSDIDDAWVTSYVALLDSLIDDVEDVKVLRKAWVIENFLSSDKEVAKIFNEVGTDLVANPSEFWEPLEYWEAKNAIQEHYESLSNTLFSQLKNEYFKSPWAIFALLGALIALFFTGVQTYYTVWSPESKCDNLCQFLKTNNHL